MTVRAMTARVTAIYATPSLAHFRTEPVSNIAVDLQGIIGGRHYGFTRFAGPREPWFKRGTPIRNNRQLTIIAAEEMAEVAALLDLPGIDPGWIGADLVLQGLPSLTFLPIGTRLFFGEAAVLMSEGVNAPCRYAGAEIATHVKNHAELDRMFVKHAKNRRGIIASVERAGVIEAGPVTVKLPPPQREQF